MSTELMNQFNDQHRGVAMVISSGSSTHFMNGTSFLLVLKQLYSEAFKRQRERFLDHEFRVR